MSARALHTYHNSEKSPYVATFLELHAGSRSIAGSLLMLRPRMSRFAWGSDGQPCARFFAHRLYIARNYSVLWALRGI
ncbi:hypothetical protein HYPDE_29693 [Hyphomicrobium denitrificans 1NES1]|uniref:Uncharacterized protein n=1 Tax=Hyphomicrobium denitrificans 1NES1 TaxID=670307 RepID=N0B3Q5_9HYPH|nr:hypothetical protein HYPDE_29693 [Hyphomicrobium denitrificans 1NES1]